MYKSYALKRVNFHTELIFVSSLLNPAESYFCVFSQFY